MNFYVRFICFILILFSYLLCAAQDRGVKVVTFEEAYKRIYFIAKLDHDKPRIDGKLDEDIWQNKGEWSENFSQVIPFEREYTESWTRVKIFYDQENLYVGIYCKDEFPETMNAFIGNRDDNSNGDLVSIAFDTYHDFQVAPEFNINLGGNKTDLTVTDKLSVNLSWNAVWEGRTHINLPDSSWTAEFRIPFSQLRYNQKNDNGVWGLHVRRIIRRNNEVQNWSLIPIKNNGHVFSFGEMHGMVDLPKPRGVEFLPYIMGKYIRDPRIPNSPYQTGNKWNGNAGFDTKIALRDFTLDLTINPDYGQVELDPSVMNLSNYEVFYEEKRPFFLEGRHVLEFDSNEGDKMFYSRRIGAMPRYIPQGIDNIGSFSVTPNFIPIIGALKLTGTNRNGVTIGFLESMTAQTSAKVTRNGVEDKEITEPLTNYAVARVQKNWEGNTLIGGMITSVNRKLTESYLGDRLASNALTGGIDFTQYFKNRLYYIDAKAMFSMLHGSSQAIQLIKKNATHYFQRESGAGYLQIEPNSRSMLGTGGYFKVGKKGNAQWNYSQLFSWLSPGFDLNDIGYVRQSDYMLNESEIAFRKTDIWGPFRSASIMLTQKNVWNYGGKAVNNDIAIRWKSLSTKHRMEMDIKETLNLNTIDSRQLRGGPDIRYNANLQTNLVFSTDRAKRVMYKFDYIGRHYFHEKTAYNEIHPGIIFRLGNHVKLTGQLNYAWNQDELQFVQTIKPTAAPNRDVVYVVGRMRQNTYGVTLNMQVNITPDISVQYYGSPFSSIARYDSFKKATDTQSKKYSKRFEIFANDDLHVEDENYRIGEGSDALYFKNPNFSFNEFRSNLVARWEYRPGASLYLIWEHNRGKSDSIYRSGWGKNMDRMWGLPSTNTFILKMNYWVGL